jgi:hypothetical protein
MKAGPRGDAEPGDAWDDAHIGKKMLCLAWSACFSTRANVS